MKARASSLVSVVYVLVAAQTVLLGGCLERELKELNPCLVSGVVAEIAVTNIDKVDLLFMVDNSGSMKEEQAALQEQFPKIINVLTSGMRSGGGEPFPPAKDLHLGVVSSDMGLAKVDAVDRCPNGLGDDGIMNPRWAMANPTWSTRPPVPVPNCKANYPQRFLTYTAGVNEQKETADDFTCMAALGTEGCGFEQQLESALKALWPAVDPMPKDGMNRIAFLKDKDGRGGDGHGDNANKDFLRNDPTTGLSLIAIIMVTDEEDCSSKTTTHFTPIDFLAPEDPLYTQDPNLRCFYNPGNLYPLERYIKGFQALRPGNENLVIFGAIVGVPPDLVTEERYKDVDWTKKEERDVFYARIMDDSRMQEMVDPSRTPQQGGNLKPSCETDVNSRAYPPRRIVQVAQGFGENGTVQSICQKDFSTAINSIIDVIARQLGAVCLPRPLVRNSDGLVGCNVVWELPPANMPHGARTPVVCGGEFPFLLPVDAGRAQTTLKGGQVCKVAQLKVEGEGAMQSQKPTTDDKGNTFTEGWYYDNFSPETQRECTGEAKQRVAFTTNAKPPTGVTVKLECLNETQSLARNRTDVDTTAVQPTIGDPCKGIVRDGVPVPTENACDVRLARPNERGEMIDKAMFCHPKQNVCVRACSTSFECPAAWVCDDRMETQKLTIRDGFANGTPICSNPTCGDSSK